MLFSTPIFLFIFLHYSSFYACLQKAPQQSIPGYLQPPLLCLGRATLCLLLVASIIFNYVFALIIGSSKRVKGRGSPRIWLGVALVFNIGLLLTFKYSSFAADS